MLELLTFETRETLVLCQETSLKALFDQTPPCTHNHLVQICYLDIFVYILGVISNNCVIFINF